jgi:hypothetical protein
VMITAVGMSGVLVGRLVGVMVGVAVGQPPPSARAGVGSKIAMQRRSKSKLRIRFMI